MDRVMGKHTDGYCDVDTQDASFKGLTCINRKYKAVLFHRKTAFNV